MTTNTEHSKVLIIGSGPRRLYRRRLCRPR